MCYKAGDNGRGIFLNGNYKKRVSETLKYIKESLKDTNFCESASKLYG
jgi:hypothetical protein